MKPNEIETVDLIASGYEWDCPFCDAPQREIEITEIVTCSECKNTYKTNPPEHAYG